MIKVVLLVLLFGVIGVAILIAAGIGALIWMCRDLDESDLA